MLSGNGVITVMQAFHTAVRKADILGSFNNTNVDINKPPGYHPGFFFRNRKRCLSLNVMVICCLDLQLYNVDTRWYTVP